MTSRDAFETGTMSRGAFNRAWQESRARGAVLTQTESLEEEDSITTSSESELTESDSAENYETETAVEGLVMKGVYRNLARKLVSSYGAPHCQNYIDNFHRYSDVNNNAGFLVKAIENEYDIPAPKDEQQVNSDPESVQAVQNPEVSKHLEECGLGTWSDMAVAVQMNDRYGYHYRQLGITWNAMRVQQYRESITHERVTENGTGQGDTT